MTTGPSDTEIISHVLQGNRQAYAELVDRYQNLVFSIVLRYIRGREDAEEVAQDVFIKAYKSLADFKGIAKFSTWLYTVATTTCLTFLRKNKLETSSLGNESVFDRVANLTSAQSANGIEQKSGTVLVNKAIGLLSAHDARVITLFYMGEQTLEEIAHILGIETNAAKVRLHRARGRLKEKMQTHFPTEVNDIY